MSKNKMYSYLARAGYTSVEHSLFLGIILIPNHNYLFIGVPLIHMSSAPDECIVNLGNFWLYRGST